MGDFLHYKLPNSTPVYKTGKFLSLAALESYDGFLVTDFTKSRLFGFEESDCEASFHFSKEVINETSKEEYFEVGNQMLSLIQNRSLEKVINSRIKKIDLEVDLSDLFNKLASENPDAFVYLISSDLFGTWIGASPETLLEFDENEYKIVSLAGTKKSNDFSDWGEKEVVEQEIVTSYIQNELDSLKVDFIEKSDVVEKIAGPVKHLQTTFSFKSHKSIHEIIHKIHPTPAVSGMPKDVAVTKIIELEKHSRSLYSGVIGDLNKHVFVNLRCMQIFEGYGLLYLGGGYTKDSDVELEWQETENKAKTLLSIIEKM